MCNCVLWQQQDHAEGSESLPWKSSIPVSLSLKKKRKGRSARNSSGGIGIDLIIIMPADDDDDDGDDDDHNDDDEEDDDDDDDDLFFSTSKPVF